MRYLFGFLCVCALGMVPVVGCSETSPNLCEGVVCDDSNECTADQCDPADGTCDNTAVEDGTECGDGAGTCEAGSCAGTFGCSEQGIRQAIVVGGGPHTFDCDGSTTVVTETTIEIDNDVILDGEGNLTIDANQAHGVFQTR